MTSSTAKQRRLLSLVLVLVLATALATALGCYSGPDGALAPATPGSDAAAEGRLPSRGSDDPSGDAAAGGGAADGVPCDVAGDGGLVPDPVDAGAVPVFADSGGPPLPSVCTSGVTSVPGSPASALMAPGGRCLGCHYVSGGPTLTLAGTVYPTLHEPDDCAGSGGGVTVVIVDAAGKSHSLPVNDAGNFLRVTALPMPYTARVVRGASAREMKTPQTDGDCNGCHTETGTHAPGRIMAP